MYCTLIRCLRQHRLGLDRQKTIDHSPCPGLCCISYPVSAPKHPSCATTAAMHHVQARVQVQCAAMHASAWLTFRRLTAEPSLASSQSDRGIQHHHRLCLRWAAEHRWIVTGALCKWYLGRGESDYYCS